MHPNPIFRSEAEQRNLDFARQRGFGILTLAGPDGPLASHIPFVIDGSRIAAHIVRSNPILEQLDEPRMALLIVSGADGYVSPDWYGVDDQVPTWNYVAVHLRGTLKRLPDQALLPHLEYLSSRFEADLPKAPWKIDKMSEKPLEKMMRMIAPIEMSIESIDGTWKLSQNKEIAARIGAADGLASSNIGQELESLTELMRKI